MKTTEAKRFRLPGSCRIALGATLGALLAGACGGTVGSKIPSIGSESHFLAYCGDGCGPGLDCIGGICTRSCLTDQSTCSDLTAGAACTNQSVEPGEVAVCDVSCGSGGSCAALGADYACDHGYCRQAPSNGSAGSGGSSTGNASGDCNPVGQYQVGKEGGYKPCCPGLTQLHTLLEGYIGDESTTSCWQPPANTFACIQGTCGDGICEDAEAPCGCGVDCPDSNWRAHPSECEYLRDQSPPPDVREISFTNTGSVDLYIQPPAPGCLRQYPLYDLLRDGQALNLEPILNGEISCQQAMDEGWPFKGQWTPGIAECPGPAPVLIKAGQTLRQPVSLEVVSQQLPRNCAAGITPDTVTCFSRAIPQPGNYQLLLHGARQLECSSATDCECHPDANGACTNRSVALRYSADLTFTFPTSNYYQSQTFELSAP